MVAKEFFGRISAIMPEIATPKKRLDLKTKLIWSGVVVIIYVVMGEISLYGIGAGAADPLLYTRIIFASSRGTLLELGIGPIVTAGLILQLLAGAEIFKFDFSNPDDRALFTAATKFLTIVITVVQAAVFLLAGMFGQDLPIANIVAIFIQLVVATMLVMMLDELVQKGWGLGSGISLFIAVGVCQQIFWSIFSPLAPGGELWGIIPYTIHVLSTGGTLISTFIRSGNAPTMIGLIMTIVVAIIIIYAEGIRIELPISHAQYRGFRGRYPVKLLYVSNIPVILASSLQSVLYMVTQIIWRSYNPNNSNAWLNWVGTFDANGTVTGGLAWFITPPNDLGQAMAEPLRAMTYVILLIILSIIFAVVWVEIGGLSPETVSQQLIDAGMQMPGFRRRKYSISLVLGKYIPVVTVIGGFFVGLIAGGAQIIGVFGSGMGILLTIDILTQYYQLLMREQLEELYPTVSRVLKVR